MTDRQKQDIRGMRRLGTSYAVIADSLDISPNTVKSFCHRENLIGCIQNDESERCKNCGAQLQQRPGARRKIFCSDKCRYTWWNHNRKYVSQQKTYRLTCLACGSEFKSYGNKNRKYCGRDCYVQSRYGEGLP